MVCWTLRFLLSCARSLATPQPYHPSTSSLPSSSRPAAILPSLLIFYSSKPPPRLPRTSKTCSTTSVSTTSEMIPFPSFPVFLKLAMILIRCEQHLILIFSLCSFSLLGKRLVLVRPGAKTEPVRLQPQPTSKGSCCAIEG